MDKNISNTINHQIQINDRKEIKITGIKKIENFDKEEFFIESKMGYILIKGENLELLKLDTIQGILFIQGNINSLIYIEEGKKKQKKESVFSKLFK